MEWEVEKSYTPNMQLSDTQAHTLSTFRFAQNSTHHYNT